MRYLVTGHTGFKGAWLTSLLLNSGHEVFGLSDEVRPNSLFAKLSLEGQIQRHLLGDICDASLVTQYVREVAPQRVIHLAAQPLVSEGYRSPARTYQVNVGGTLNVIQGTLEGSSARLLIVTTDKVYTPLREYLPFSEDSPIGASDPYGNSKAIADLATLSLAQSYPDRVIRVARAGNVIGFGDDTPNRLLPDVVQAIKSSSVLELRNPQATRPWQHVLDCVASYIEFLELDDGAPLALNFGPQDGKTITVAEVVELAAQVSNAEVEMAIVGEIYGLESLDLQLDSSISFEHGMRNVFSQKESIELTTTQYLNGEARERQIVQETLELRAARLLQI